jgi:hypothetical protein
MKKTTWLLTCVLILCLGVSYHYAQSLKPLPVYKLTVTKMTVDERGLITVQFTDGMDTAAYDYLTQHEFDQFLKHNDPYWDTEDHSNGF